MKMNSGATMNSFSVPRSKATLASTSRLAGLRKTTIMIAAVSPIANPAGVPIAISPSIRPTSRRADQYHSSIRCRSARQLGAATVALQLLTGGLTRRMQERVDQHQDIGQRQQAETHRH